MDLNWCPVCEQHIPLAWESSLYCSERCKKADAMASAQPSSLGGGAYPSFDFEPLGSNKKRNTSVAYTSPLSSPSLSGFQYPTTGNSNSHHFSPSATYPSPPTSPLTMYLDHKTTSGRMSPPLFSLGLPATSLSTTEMTATTVGGVVNGGYNHALRRMSNASQHSISSKKGGFFW
ncbi:hypothetical protein BGW38_004741 [Lunasporangiospora selenospora]|uniref:Uncharacterized protein n=1 Tax=Lunasporangiospora selenospora TaxID=979761 RepID=A0A9P6KBY1_9FUNG|nr:hypothetical protein BGW38_004741 [Lunasporangiospora selenospora]